VGQIKPSGDDLDRADTFDGANILAQGLARWDYDSGLRVAHC
jgi:hypothetical protein